MFEGKTCVSFQMRAVLNQAGICTAISVIFRWQVQPRSSVQRVHQPVSISAPQPKVSKQFSHCLLSRLPKRRCPSAAQAASFLIIIGFHASFFTSWCSDYKRVLVPPSCPILWLVSFRRTIAHGPIFVQPNANFALFLDIPFIENTWIFPKLHGVPTVDNQSWSNPSVCQL